MYTSIKHDKTFSHTPEHLLHLYLETLTETGNRIQLSFLFHFKLHVWQISLGILAMLFLSSSMLNSMCPPCTANFKMQITNISCSDQWTKFRKHERQS